MTAMQKVGLIGRRAVKTGLEGLQTLGAAQSLVGDVALTPSAAWKVKVPDIGPLKGGELTLRPEWEAGQVRAGAIPNIISNIIEKTNPN